MLMFFLCCQPNCLLGINYQKKERFYRQGRQDRQGFFYFPLVKFILACKVSVNEKSILEFYNIIRCYLNVSLATLVILAVTPFLE